jgi:hypothetical protein
MIGREGDRRDEWEGEYRMIRKGGEEWGIKFGG